MESQGAGLVPASGVGGGIIMMIIIATAYRAQSHHRRGSAHNAGCGKRSRGKASLEFQGRFASVTLCVTEDLLPSRRRLYLPQPSPSP